MNNMSVSGKQFRDVVLPRSKSTIYSLIEVKTLNWFLLYLTLQTFFPVDLKRALSTRHIS